MKIQEWKKPGRGPETPVWSSLKDPLKGGVGQEQLADHQWRWQRCGYYRMRIWGEKDCWERDDGAKFLH